jgi:dihydroorotase
VTQTLRIEGARVIDPAAGRDGKLDLRLSGGKIEAVDRPGAFGKAREGEKIIAARGLWVMPGFVDMHVHLREPGEEYKEDIASGLRAAAAGGFPSVCCMPNTVPVNDTRAVTEMLLRRAAQVGAARLHPVAAITRGREGRELTEMGDLLDAGAVAFSDDGCSVRDAGMMRRAMDYAAGLDALIIEHAEDASLVAGGLSHEGEVGTRAGLGGMPAEAEELIVARDVILARLTGARLHIAHISSLRSVEIVRRAKDEGLPVTAEVTPHHLLLSDAATGDYDTRTKVNPPLRSEEHRRALLEAARDGVIDAVATDHAPHSVIEKEGDFASAAFGISGLETAAALMLRLVEEGQLKPAAVARLLAAGPSRVLRLPGGRIEPGAPADLTLLDPESPATIDPAAFVSKGRNTPFGGWKVPGRVAMTIREGVVIHGRI